MIPASLKRLLQAMKPHAGRILLALLTMGMTAATEPALVWMLKVLLDRGFAGIDRPSGLVTSLQAQNSAPLDRKSVV